MNKTPPNKYVEELSKVKGLQRMWNSGWALLSIILDVQGLRDLGRYLEDAFYSELRIWIYFTIHTYFRIDVFGGIQT